jgi:hypothetical protein
VILPSRTLARRWFKDQSAPLTWRVGWWVFYAACFLGSTLLLADLPPGSYVPLLLFAVLQGLLLGPVFLVGVWLGVRRALAERQWIAVAPLMPWASTALLLAGVAGTVLGDLPERLAFRLSRPALDGLLAEAAALPPEIQSLPSRRLGLYLADEVRKAPSGRVRFVVRGTRLFGTEHGLIWARDPAELPGAAGYRFDPWGDGWYQFRKRTVP